MPDKNILNVFIDESGTLPDPKDKFLVICAVVAREAREAENLISRVLESLKQTRDSLKLKELKFYHARQAVKRVFLAAIVSAGLEIFTLVVDKKHRKIPDSPENFAILLAELVSEIFFWYKLEKLNLIIDRHFYQRRDQEKFDEALRSCLKYKAEWQLQIKHLASQSNLSVNIADVCAGAVLWKYSRGNTQFYDIIKDSILVEKISGQPEIKKKQLKVNKNSPEPA